MSAATLLTRRGSGWRGRAEFVHSAAWAKLHLDASGAFLEFLPIPATFVVSMNGHIIDRYVDPDFRNRVEIADIITALNRSSV